MGFEPMHLDSALHHVLARYPDFPSGEVPVFLGNHGGFSGARLWRVRQGTLCLKAWPVNGMSAEYLGNLHESMREARAAGLDFVPDVLRTRDGQTVVELAGRVWDLTTWMPGTADFHQHPSAERVRAACLALARLHGVWARFTTADRCPAVLRRLKAVMQWEELRRQGWRPVFPKRCVDPVQPWAERAWDLVLRHMEGLTNPLFPFAVMMVPTHECLCDIWHDHVLFRGSEVSGVVDYGSLKRDHPAVDLARLLGSLVGDNKEWWAVGLQSYRKVRPLQAWEERLVEHLDRTGTVLSAANWLRWLYHEDRQYEDRQAVAERLAAIVLRLE
jgi:Ser/Thr protein kinase RdoA (MazF antagonist)